MSINKISKITVDILFYAGIVCVAAVPFSSKLIQGYYGYDTVAALIFLAMLFLSGLCAVYILFNLRVMFKTLLGGNPFVDRNVRCLTRIAAACAGISAVYIVKTVLLFSWATLVIAIVFAVGCLFSMTLKSVFEQAIEYKRENDLTI